MLSWSVLVDALLVRVALWLVALGESYGLRDAIVKPRDFAGQLIIAKGL